MKLMNENPAKWIRSLPRIYSGAYLRAGVVGGRTLQDKLNDESINESVREFLKQRLSDPNQVLNRSNSALCCCASGAVRFTVWVKKSHAHVIQRGRFANDERFWGEHLSTHKVGFRDHAKHLSFALHTVEDFRFFQDTMEQEIAGFHWTLAQTDGDEGQENEGEDQ